jgi:hypothetical protein
MLDSWGVNHHQSLLAYHHYGHSHQMMKNSHGPVICSHPNRNHLSTDTLTVTFAEFPDRDHDDTSVGTPGMRWVADGCCNTGLDMAGS